MSNFDLGEIFENNVGKPLKKLFKYGDTDETSDPVKRSRVLLKSRDKNAPSINAPTSTLVLAIRVTSSNIIHFLQKGDYISEDLGEDLYQCTKFLWIGSQQDFNEQISSLFLPYNLGVKSNEESEYDVYLLRIQLRDYDEGFMPNISSNRRADAFLRLPEIGKLADISKRLAINSCENIGFYQC